MKVAGKRTVRLAPPKDRTEVAPAVRRCAATAMRRKPRSAATSATVPAESSRRRQELPGLSVALRAVARLLGISDQAVSDRLAAGDLVGLKDGRVWKLPSWQFDADTENGWLPGIADLRQHFPAGPVSLTAWVTTPNVDLDDRTPAAQLAAGDVAQVLRAAQASGPW